MEELDHEFLAVYWRLPDHVRWQKVLGLDTRDALSEMRMVAWQAWLKWERKDTFNRFFWTCWHHHKINLLESWLAKKRPRLVLVECELEALAPLVKPEDLFPECPDQDPVARGIWALLGLGYERREILSLLSISKRTYESWRLSWRRPEVRLSLAC